MLFRSDAANLGHSIRGAEVLALLRGDIRPTMVTALDRVREAGYKTACLTNNVAGGDGRTTAPADERDTEINLIMARFDAVIESSKVGVRKPEIEFYELACATLDVAPDECVFLDDLGINLKPAAANDQDPAGGVTSWLRFYGVMGRNYIIAVDSFPTGGRIQFNLSQAPNDVPAALRPREDF